MKHDHLMNALEEWRAARQDIFDNASKVSIENEVRWMRLSIAEHELMRLANMVPRS